VNAGEEGQVVADSLKGECSWENPPLSKKKSLKRDSKFRRGVVKGIRTMELWSGKLRRGFKQEEEARHEGIPGKVPIPNGPWSGKGGKENYPEKRENTRVPATLWSWRA